MTLDILTCLPGNDLTSLADRRLARREKRSLTLRGHLSGLCPEETRRSLAVATTLESARA